MNHLALTNATKVALELGMNAFPRETPEPAVAPLAAGVDNLPPAFPEAQLLSQWPHGLSYEVGKPPVRLEPALLSQVYLKRNQEPREGDRGASTDVNSLCLPDLPQR